MNRRDVPVLAATVNAIADSHAAAPMLGAALELMNASLHKLHSGCGKPGRHSYCVNLAGDILAGDYLSAGALRLLLKVDNLPVMQLVAEAVQSACDGEMFMLDGPFAGQEVRAAMGEVGWHRSAPLGGAAGAAAALLAGCGKDAVGEAQRIGYCTAVATYWSKQWRVEIDPQAVAIGRSLACESIEEAKVAASRFHALTGNEAPARLCASLRHVFGLERLERNISPL
jgi:hypothetical protein